MIFKHEGSDNNILWSNELMTPQENNIIKDIYILELIIIKIKKYLDNSVFISDLIYDLETYLDQLSVVDPHWRKDFRTTWLDIEIAYSLALDQGLEKPVNDGNTIILNSLNILKKMAHDQIKILKAEL